MYPKKRCLLLGFMFVMIVILLSGWNSQVQSQEKYPSRAIEIIVPFAPGASTDVVNRIIAAYLNRKWGVPVNVVNKPGGNTVPACLEVYRATPDGYTILGDNNPSSSMTPIVVRNLPYKIMDRTFIAMTAISPMAVIVYPPSSYKSLKDLEIEAKKDPENFTWTSLGGAGGHDFTTRQFLKAIGVDVAKTKPIMCQGGSQAVVLTAGGNAKMGLGTVSACLPGIKGGTVRPLVVTSKQRWSDLPDVPTTLELGYPTVNHHYWMGISGPPKLPSHIAEAWDKALQEMLKDPDIISKLKNVGSVPFYHNAQEMKEFVSKETDEVAILWGIK
jgi:tripartite-type tricarboxylate transporter receptor subunit TctC